VVTEELATPGTEFPFLFVATTEAVYTPMAPTRTVHVVAVLGFGEQVKFPGMTVAV
jgi:hypothetical protein